MNYRIVTYVLGWALNIEAFSMLLPLLCAVAYNEPNKWVFLVCALICALVGTPLVLAGHKNKAMYAKEGFASVALSWIVISIFGAIPFVMSGAIPNFVDALFETASGFSTTGASILTDLDVLPKSIIFWRSFTHWMGGMGVIVFLVAILPVAGGNNLHLLRAESPGHSVGKLVPRVRTTAKILYLIYIGLTVIEIVLLMLGGLDLFEASTLSFGTAGTGGFSIKNSGLTEETAYIQNVITVFMMIFGVDFAFYYLILMRRIKTAFKLEEVISYFVIIAVAITLISINVNHMYASVGETIKHSAFQVGSIITTTGYATTDFNLWPQFSKTILLLLMFCGACTGSTGGGMKVSRITILAKSIVKEIKVLAHPKSTVKVKYNGKVLEHETLRGITVFFIAYMLIFAFAFLVVSLENFDFATTFTSVLATLSNIGPGLAKVGPMGNFAEFSALSKIVLTMAMIIGRLEIFPILVLFSRKTWKR